MNLSLKCLFFFQRIEEDDVLLLVGHGKEGKNRRIGIFNHDSDSLVWNDGIFFDVFYKLPDAGIDKSVTLFMAEADGIFV